MVLSRLLSIEITTVLLVVLVIFSAIGLTVSHKILVKKGKSLKIWYAVCFLPLTASVIHFAFHFFKGNEVLTLQLYGGLYFAAVLVALLALFMRKKFMVCTVISNIASVVGCLFTLLMLAANFPAIHNMTSQSYTDSFLSTVERMKQEYVLSEWKEIDYDSIVSEILPMVEKAESENDPVEFYIAMMKYASYFYDGHVGALADGENGGQIRAEARKRLAGNDYGFVMYTLENGKTAAFMVDENSEAYKNGIRSGTVITSWNGQPIDEAIAEVEVIYTLENGGYVKRLYTFPVAENEDMLKPLLLSGKGGDEVIVGYIDENGIEQTVVLASQGKLYNRLDSALSRLFAVQTTDRSNNFNTYMLTDNCGYLQINSESYEFVTDIKAYITGSYLEITEMLTEKLTELEQQGMDRLIIDLRNNSGGSGEISAAVAALFTEEKKLLYIVDGTNKVDGIDDDRYVHGVGTFKDLDVVVLVNSTCASAGDMMTKQLMSCENVTVMGISGSNCCGQASGGVCVLTDSNVSIAYPVNRTLDENGVYQIDTKPDRVTRLSIDVYIPVTEEAAVRIFDNSEDYELEYALEYLSKE